MVYTSGKDKGFVHSGAGFVITETAANYYTEIHTTDGKKIRFSLNFDFDRKCRNRIYLIKTCAAVSLN